MNLRRLVLLLIIVFIGLASLPLATAATRYTDNLDGTITDTTTGLMWKRCSEGQTWTGVTCSGDTTEYTWDDAKALTDFPSCRNSLP